MEKERAREREELDMWREELEMWREELEMWRERGVRYEREEIEMRERGVRDVERERS